MPVLINMIIDHSGTSKWRMICVYKVGNKLLEAESLHWAKVIPQRSSPFRAGSPKQPLPGPSGPGGATSNTKAQRADTSSAGTLVIAMRQFSRADSMYSVTIAKGL
jgi:hypothetical protein